jgi:hypothetical protein
MIRSISNESPALIIKNNMNISTLPVMRERKPSITTAIPRGMKIHRKRDL